MKKVESRKEFFIKKEIEELKTGLIKNVINGYVIKRQIQDIVEVNLPLQNINI